MPRSEFRMLRLALHRQVVEVGVSCTFNPNTDPATGVSSTVELLTPNHCIPPLDGDKLKARAAAAGQGVLTK